MALARADFNTRSRALTLANCKARAYCRAMEVRPWPLRAASQDLSKAEGFALGPLTVDPPTRRVGNGARDAVLEPRVMRVLVALAAAERKVLSRDDLIELCWDGQIVGDNAINRVISRLRQTFADMAGDEVRLETITKVGFRLVVNDGADFDHVVMLRPNDKEQADVTLPAGSRPRAFDRRRFGIGGAATLAVAALGYAGWVRATAHRPDPEAVRLLMRGNTVMRSARLGSTPEAIKLFGQAVKVDPKYADAWGALASSYRHALDGYGRGERQSYPNMVRSAAERALALDSEQPDALIAVAAIYPEYRNWLSQERELRALVERFPQHWYANARMGILLQQVGRFEEALTFSVKVPQIDTQLAPAWAGLMRTLTTARRFHQADAAYEEAMAHIAPHPAVWMTRYSSLLESRRYGEATAFARDTRTFPEEFPARMAQNYGDIAAALATDDSNAIASAVTYVMAATKDRDYIPRGAPLLAMLGAKDAALDGYAVYLFGGEFNKVGFAVPGPLDLRDTDSIFRPSLIAMRGDPRHAELLRRSGLEEYWGRSGSQPDFRRS